MNTICIKISITGPHSLKNSFLIGIKFLKQLIGLVRAILKEVMNQQRAPIRNVKREKESNSKERYNEMCERFLQGEFTYDAHCIIEKLTEKGKSEPHMEGVQLYRILIQICKLLLLNELEILFLGATLQEMKWKIIDPCLSPYMEGFKSLSPKLKSDNYNKKMQVSLLLIGYIVKLYLNEDIQIFDFKMRELVTKDYDKMYQEWVEKMKKNFKFNPKNMNKLFKELDIIRAKKTVELDNLNYNNKVLELFQKYISDDLRDYSHDDRTPIRDEEIEEEQIPPKIFRESSMQSVKSLNQRESYRELISRNEREIFLRDRMSFLRNNSQDDFMG